MDTSKEALARLLNGREYGEEITREEEEAAKKCGLIVLFGASDDLAEFRGAFNEEIGCYGDSIIHVNWKGPMDAHDEDCDCPFCGYESLLKQCAVIIAEWSKEPYSWSYKTDLPHATFEIVEGSEKYCRGIVFERGALPVLKR